MSQYRGNVRAPEFPVGMEWLNVDRPISLKSLSGKIVLLDFWTYCCINCMHIIPELRKLEERFPETLVVIGVHSPKYTAERSVENVREAVIRYGIEHPVVNDPNHAIWDEYAISSWPTTVLICPEGRVVGVQPGEFEADAYAETISTIESDYDREARLVRFPSSFRQTLPEPHTPLLYPGKVLADRTSNRIFIADSSHNRIVVTDFEGKLLDIVGNGARGSEDGPFPQASFNRPQGMALEGESLYVADTENHLIRQVNLSGKTVETIAGTGRQARHSRRGGEALFSDLSSPWDLAIKDNVLYIAMAGNHQIWTVNLDSGMALRIIGTGREALSDGTLERCALAQTSGLSLEGNNLYFADSETSSVRVAHLLEDRVETIVGAGLFDFGDIDGLASDARMQHCLGVTYHDGLLYVADSYNNKIKVIDPISKTVDTLLGDGTTGFVDGEGKSARFWEPGGLSISGDVLFISDTNNHAIRVADLQTKSVTTLTISI